MTTGQKIKASEYNAIRTKVQEILGTTGFGTRGYGQPLQSSTVTAELDVASRKQWNDLRNDIINVKLHQDGVAPNIVEIPLTDPIRYGSAHPNTNFNAVIDQATITRLNIGENRFVIQEGSSESTNNQWNTQASIEASVTFANANEARYFFNSGGKLRILSSRTGGTPTAQNTAWSSLLFATGPVELRATGPETSKHFYNLTNDWEVLFQTNSSTPYAANEYRIEVKCDVPDNQSATARIIYFRVFWIDNYNDPGPPNPPDLVDGTLSFIVEELKASGLTVPVLPATEIVAGRWYSILSAGSTSFTAIGAPDNLPETVFLATDTGTGSGTVNGVFYIQSPSYSIAPFTLS
jgi:hypothetical protein